MNDSGSMSALLCKVLFASAYLIPPVAPSPSLVRAYTSTTVYLNTLNVSNITHMTDHPSPIHSSSRLKTLSPSPVLMSITSSNTQPVINLAASSFATSIYIMRATPGTSSVHSLVSGFDLSTSLSDENQTTTTKPLHENLRTSTSPTFSGECGASYYSLTDLIYLLIVSAVTTLMW